MPNLAPGFNQFGNAWIIWSHLETVRAQASLELSAIAQAGFNTIVVLFSPYRENAAGKNAELRFPNPTSDELWKMVSIVQLAARFGLRTLLSIGNPGVIRNSVMLANPRTDNAPVCGRNEGEVVNGERLWWYPPAVAGNDYIERAHQFYDAIGAALTTYVPTTVAGVELCGMPRYAYGVELNVFHSGAPQPWKDDATAYLNQLLTSLAVSWPLIPWGPSLFPSYWQADKLDGLRYVRDHVDLSAADFIDVNANWQEGLPSLAAIRDSLGGRTPLLGDGGLHGTHGENAGTLGDRVRRLLELGTSCWWWQYKSIPHQGEGLRLPGYIGPTGGWTEGAEVVRAWPNKPPLCGVRFGPEIVNFA